MMDLLRDPVWQFVGVTLTLLTIVVPIATYYAQRPRKLLGYEIIHNGKILTITEESVGKLQLLYNGAPVHNARLIELRISNVGNQSILPTDFFKTLSVSVNESAVILSAAVVDKQPKDLNVEATFSANVLEITPLLLNAQDSITLKLLVSGYQTGPTLSARINGVTKITEIRPNYIPNAIFLTLSLACLLTAVWLKPATERPPLRDRILETPLPYLLATIGVILLLAAAGRSFMMERAAERTNKKKRQSE